MLFAVRPVITATAALLAALVLLIPRRCGHPTANCGAAFLSSDITLPSPLLLYPPLSLAPRRYAPAAKNAAAAGGEVAKPKKGKGKAKAGKFVAGVPRA